MDPALAAGLTEAVPDAFAWLTDLTDNIFDAATADTQIKLAEEETAQAQAAAAAAQASADAAAAASSSSSSLSGIISAHPYLSAGVVVGGVIMAIALVRR